MFSTSQVLIITATVLAITLAVTFYYRTRILAVVVPLILTFGLLAAFLFGCSPTAYTDGTLHIPEESPSVQATATPTSAPKPKSFENTPSPAVTAATVDIESTDPSPEAEVSELPSQEPVPTPQIIEVPVEVPRDVIVELPGETIEVIKEVYVDTPLAGMDMRERKLSFIDELNTEYADIFGMIIGGGDYCYGFTSQTEYIINYFFITADDKVIASHNFIPLRLNADQAIVDSIIQEIRNKKEES